MRDAPDADIGAYRVAIESIVTRGGWVIRMGNPYMTPLPPMPQVIDYVHTDYFTDWMDVFLWASCRFFIGTQSGPQLVPPSFGVPCVLTNFPSIGIRLWFSQNIQIFKLRWSEKESRYLNFSEIITSDLGWAESTEYLASMGVKLVDNTPEEINDAVMEMMDGLEGKQSYSREDEELQKRFDKVCNLDAYKKNSRIGRDFLRKWAHLL